MKVGFRKDGVIKALDVRFHVDAGCSLDVSLLVRKTLVNDLKMSIWTRVVHHYNNVFYLEELK